MIDRKALLIGMGFGLGAGFLVDPSRGTRRRALARDRAVHTARLGRDGAGATARDPWHRTKGTLAAVRSGLRGDPVDDGIVIERVRAKLGRLISHPHAVRVTAENGIVTLSGPILEDEVDRLVRSAGRIRGVRQIVNHLETHPIAGNVPALQGGRDRGEPRADIFQRAWAPATRFVVGAGGLALAGYGVRRRHPSGALLLGGGLALLLRAGTNLNTRRLIGVGGRRRAVDVQKTMTLDAPIETVFGFWSAYENFPRFMSRVLEVRPSARPGQSHWRVEGPAGIPIEFNAEVTQNIPNQVLAWRTMPDSAVAHAGIVRFEPTPDQRTRVHVRFSYDPPGGWFGHVAAAAFSVDPKSSFDADLTRMKTMIETGRPAHDAAAPTPEESSRSETDGSSDHPCARG